MKKLGCAKCGGSMKKMATGGSTTNKLNKPKAPVKPQTGGSNTKMGIYGIPNAGRTDQLGFKKGGAVKKMQNGGKVNYMPSKAAYEKSISDMGGPDNPPVQLEPREIYKAKMDQKKRSVVNKMYPTTGIPKKGVGAKKYAKGGSSFGMLSVKAGVDKNPKPTAADRIAGAKMKMRKKK